MSYTVKQIKSVAAKFLSKDLTGKLVDEFSELEPASKSGRKTKDPNAPKGAKSAYILFSMENRAKVQKKNKNKSNAEVTKLLGEAWKELSDKKKEKYTELAAEDKKRFEKEKKSYEKKNPETKSAAAKAKTKSKAEKAEKPKAGSKVDRTSYDQLMKLSRADLSAIVKEMRLGKVTKAAGNTRGAPKKEDYAKAISKVAKKTKTGASKAEPEKKPKPEPKAKPKAKKDKSEAEESEVEASGTEESDELETGVESGEESEAESDSKVDDEAEEAESEDEVESGDEDEAEEAGSDDETVELVDDE